MLHAFYLDTILRVAGDSGGSVCILKVMFYVRIFIIANNQNLKPNLKHILLGGIITS